MGGSGGPETAASENRPSTAGIPIGAGILYPTFGILLSPIIAATAMALSSGGVVGKALRLRVTRLSQERSSAAASHPFTFVLQQD